MTHPRDASGPDHKPEITQVTEIDGVVTSTFPFVRYEQENVLTEMYRPEWVGVFAEGEPIDHLYMVSAPIGGIRKEWYYHEHTLDRYVLIKGKVDLGLYDGRESSPTFGNFILISLGESGTGLPHAVRIPPLVWHSLKWVTDEGIFMNAKLPGYERNLPDKFRVTKEELPAAITWNI